MWDEIKEAWVSTRDTDAVVQRIMEAADTLRWAEGYLQEASMLFDAVGVKRCIAERDAARDELERIVRECMQ